MSVMTNILEIKKIIIIGSVVPCRLVQIICVQLQRLEWQALDDKHTQFELRINGTIILHARLQ